MLRSLIDAIPDSDVVNILAQADEKQDVVLGAAEKKRRDNVRMLVSSGALFILAGTIGLTFYASLGGKQSMTWANWGPLAATLFPAEFAILGSIVAFYMSKD
jgi:hypothetical protein